MCLESGATEKGERGRNGELGHAAILLQALLERAKETLCVVVSRVHAVAPSTPPHFPRGGKPSDVGTYGYSTTQKLSRTVQRILYLIRSSYGIPGMGLRDIVPATRRG